MYPVAKSHWEETQKKEKKILDFQEEFSFQKMTV